MSWRKALGKLLLFGVLQLGAMTGVPMTPEQIEKLMQVLHRTNIVHVIKQETDGE